MIHDLAKDGRAVKIGFPDGPRWIAGEEKEMYRNIQSESEITRILKRYILTHGPTVGNTLARRYGVGTNCSGNTRELSINGDLVKTSLPREMPGVPDSPSRKSIGGQSVSYGRRSGRQQLQGSPNFFSGGNTCTLHRGLLEVVLSTIVSFNCRDSPFPSIYGNAISSAHAYTTTPARFFRISLPQGNLSGPAQLEGKHVSSCGEGAVTSPASNRDRPAYPNPQCASRSI
jgi:hypothetical protein